MSNLLESTLFDPKINKDWHMQFSERAALMYILERAKPDISLEIGTLLGGSLRSIAAASRNVYSFDIDDRALPGFPNVSFVLGNSFTKVPEIINEINASDDREINFILIDADHSENAVKTDITNCLRYRPKRRPTIILMHDSSNPHCRKGMIDAPWSDCPYVHGLDLDFVPGMLYDREDIKGQMWGGLAAAVMLPEKRSGSIAMSATFEHSRLALLEKSIYT